MPWLIGVTATILLVISLPTPDTTGGTSRFLPLQVSLEVLAIAIAGMVFGVSWQAQRFRPDGRVMVLGTALLGVAVLDLAHTLSLPGMPDLVSKNSEEKASLLWLFARLTTAVAMVVAALVPLRQANWLAGVPRIAFLAVGLVYPALLVYAVVFHQTLFPATFEAEGGLTVFKVRFDYVLIALHLLAWIGFLRKPRVDGGLGYRHLAVAAAAMAISEFFVSRYHIAHDVYSLVGLAYKVLAYAFVYKGLFVAIIEEPFRRLSESQASNKATLDALPDLLFEVDGQGTYLAVHAGEPHKLAVPANQLIGRRIADVLPPAASAACMGAIDEAAVQGVSRGRRLSLPLPEGDLHFELSVARRPVQGTRPPTYLVLSRDVTTVAKAEQHFEREARLHAAIAELQRMSLDAPEGRLLQRGLAFAEELTESVISFVHFVNDDQNTIELITWSERTLSSYCRAAYDRHYPVAMAGIWAEALRAKAPVVFNDYASAAGRRGLPEGHADLTRLISLPVLQGDKVRMLIGVGNRPDAYRQEDVELLQRLAEVLWQMAVQGRQLETIRRLSLALDQSPYPVLITDAMARIDYVNAAFTEVTGYSAEEVEGKNPGFLKSGETPPESYEALWASLRAGRPWHGEFVNRRKDGRLYTESVLIYPVTAADGRTTHYVAHKEDITEKLEARKRIAALSDFDPLTGLINRRNFDGQLARRLQAAATSGEKLLVLWINIDDFKTVNAALGHAAGDEVLVMLAYRLREALGGDAILTRFSGDTFIAAMPFADQAGALITAKTAVTLLSSALHIRETTLALSASAGVAIYPEDGDSAAQLCAAAEVAMHHVKRDGRNGLRFFSARMQESSRRSLELSAALALAVGRGELRVVYQPQRCLRTGALTGAEALLRWEHPGFGTVSPAEFIPMAERNGTINAIGHWVLEQAVSRIAAWDAEGLAGLVVAVNVSAVQFVRREWLDELLALVGRHGVSPRRIEIELTEAVALRDPEGAVRTIGKLHEAGFRIALDDFGTGFSSLTYLRRFAIDKLKIDQGFIRGIEQSPGNQEIVKAIIRMGHGLGMRVIAEGVEEESAVRFLSEQGCDEIQGYVCSRPLDAEAFVDFARRATGVDAAR